MVEKYYLRFWLQVGSYTLDYRKNMIQFLKQHAIDPRNLQQFLTDYLDIAMQLNDLINELNPITHQKNKIMLTQIELLILLLDDFTKMRPT